MPRVPDPQVSSPTSAKKDDLALAVKDGLREARFVLKHKARSVVQELHAATQRHQGSVPAPLAALAEPFDLAVRTTANVMRTVDRAAVDLLSSDGSYRTMTMPLRASASYLAQGLGLDKTQLRTFTKDHYWRYRHLLQFRGYTDVFVHELAIEMAGMQVVETLPSGGLAHELAQRINAHLILALKETEILTRPADGSPENDACEPDLRKLSAHTAIAVVLAGEIADMSPLHDARRHTETSLRLADEITTACEAKWLHALKHPDPAEALASWLHFVCRHF